MTFHCNLKNFYNFFSGVKSHPMKVWYSRTCSILMKNDEVLCKVIDSCLMFWLFVPFFERSKNNTDFSLPQIFTPTDAENDDELYLELSIESSNEAQQTDFFLSQDESGEISFRYIFRFYSIFNWSLSRRKQFHKNVLKRFLSKKENKKYFYFEDEIETSTKSKYKKVFFKDNTKIIIPSIRVW